MNNKLVDLQIGPVKIDYEPPEIKIARFELAESDFPVQVLGSNGAGKSSLALGLAGAIPNAIWARIDLPFQWGTMRETLSLYEVGEMMSIVPQSWEQGFLGFGLPTELSMRSADASWSRFLLRSLGLEQFRDRDLSTLSSGERRRLLIGKGLASRPDLLIADEWDQFLDEQWKRRIFSLFDECRENFGMKLLHLSSHELPELQYRRVLKLQSSIEELEGHDRPSVSTVLAEISDSLAKCVRRQVSGGLGVKQAIAIRNPLVRGSLVELETCPGQITAVSGPNGSGKTSTLTRLWKLSRSWRYRYRLSSRSKAVSVHLVQADPLYEVLGPTIGDEVGRALRNVELHWGAERELLDNLGDQAHRDVLTLSFGERKLLAILLGVLRGQDILAIDEPFAGLDEENRKVVRSLFQTATSRGLSLVVAEQKSTLDASRIIDLDE